MQRTSVHFIISAAHTGSSGSYLCEIGMEYVTKIAIPFIFKWLACIYVYYDRTFTYCVHTHKYTRINTVSDTLSMPKINLCVKTLCIRWQINFQSFSISHTFSSVARFSKVDFPIEPELFAYLNFNVNG